MSLLLVAGGRLSGDYPLKSRMCVCAGEEKIGKQVDQKRLGCVLVRITSNAKQYGTKWELAQQNHLPHTHTSVRRHTHTCTIVVCQRMLTVENVRNENKEDGEEAGQRVRSGRQTEHERGSHANRTRFRAIRQRRSRFGWQKRLRCGNGRRQ